MSSTISFFVRFHIDNKNGKVSSCVFTLTIKMEKFDSTVIISNHICHYVEDLKS